MREIKFRVWDPEAKSMMSWESLSHSRMFNIEQSHDDIGWEWLQYTGLHDKNGKEIYEGDIVKETHEIAQITRKNTYTNNVADEIIGEYKIENEIHEVKWGSYDDGEYVSNIECWMWGERSLSDYLSYPVENKTSYWSFKNRRFEIIGNIYEHSNLLEEKL